MSDLFTTLAPPRDLYPHQTLAIEEVRASMARGNRRVVLGLPTGAGKTLVAARIIQRAMTQKKRVIFTVPLLSLIEKTLGDFLNEGINDVGVIQGDHRLTNAMAGVQIASVQTLARRDTPAVDLLIVDECHAHAKVIEDLAATRPTMHCIGLSATPWAKGMGLLWEDLVNPITTSELIGQGLLSSFIVYAPDVPNLAGLKMRAGDFDERGLLEVMGKAQLVGSVVDTWLAKGDNRPTLCFAVNRAHADLLHRQFEAAGVASAYVDGKTHRAERAEIERLFRAGEIRVVCSVRTMTTGVDLPVSCIIDAAPTRSDMLHVQKIGRGLRRKPGTEDCVIFDHAGNSLRLGLVTDINHDSLDQGMRRAASSSHRAKDRKLPNACVACHVLFVGRLCPNCGYERRAVCKVEAAEGELKPISGKIRIPSKEEKQRFWSMALRWDDLKGKGGKLALALYKKKFGCWPRRLRDIRLEPDQAFMNYVKSRHIAYGKRPAAESRCA